MNSIEVCVLELAALARGTGKPLSWPVVAAEGLVRCRLVSL
jgi:hypothetical protein